MSELAKLTIEGATRVAFVGFDEVEPVVILCFKLGVIVVVDDDDVDVAEGTIAILARFLI